MMKYQDEGKFKLQFTSENAWEEILKDRNVKIIESYFDTSTKLGAQAMANSLVYKNSKNMSCITEDYINSRRYRKPEKVEFLYSMLHSEAGTPILTTGIKDDFLQITIPYFPNSGEGKIEVKYRFVPFKGFSSYKDALQKIDVDSILSDYPVSIQIIHHGDPDDFPDSLDSVDFSSGHILIIWTETSEETTEKKSSLTSEEIDRFTKSAKENNKFAK